MGGLRPAPSEPDSGLVGLGLELVRGIVDDVYMLSRGYEPAIYVGWIVLHIIIIATGLWALRKASREANLAAAA